MKTLAAVLAVAALSGCAVHNNEWVAPAVVGAAAGIVIHEAVKNPHPHSHPQYHPRPHMQPLPPRPLRCDYYPIYDAWGYYRGDRRVCY